MVKHLYFYNRYRKDIAFINLVFLWDKYIKKVDMLFDKIVFFEKKY